jgi:hypothetical protein
MDDPRNFPEVPVELRPKPFYTNSNLDPEGEAALRVRGWRVVDVRLLPSATDAERAQAIKCWLEGIRMNTIEGANKTLMDFLELEGKTCGLIGNKAPTNEGVKKVSEETDALLDIGSKRAFAGQVDPLANLEMKKPPSRKKVAKP